MPYLACSLALTRHSYVGGELMNPQPSSERILGGSLETMGLQGTLKMLAMSDKTGQLSVEAVHEDTPGSISNVERLDIYLRKGNIVALHSDDPMQIDLLEMLRLLRRIDRKDAVEMRAYVGTQLPQVLSLLVERGFMTAAQQQQHIEFEIIQEISRALRWERGTFAFHTNVKVVESTLTPLSVDHVLLEALRMWDEWGKVTTGLNRYSTPRWLPEFKGDVRELKLSREEVSVLFLSNGQIPIYAIAYALLIPEAQIASIVEHLVELNLVEVIDDHYERQLEQNLMRLLTVSQDQLRFDHRASADQRLHTLLVAMSTCINKLMSHFGTYARALRGRTPGDAEVTAYVTQQMTPMLRRLQIEFPIMETAVLHGGEIDLHEIFNLPRLVKGNQLETFYWEAAQALFKMMTETFDMIIADEIGPTRSSRRFYDLWGSFAQEIGDEMERHRVRRLTASSRRSGQPSAL
jgi:hypothetical protein